MAVHRVRGGRNPSSLPQQVGFQPLPTEAAGGADSATYPTHRRSVFRCVMHPTVRARPAASGATVARP